jgi:Fe-S oxidoreductase
VKVKTAQGPSLKERALSVLFRHRAVTSTAASLLAPVQKLWQKNGHFRPLPLAWTKGKRLPLLRPKKAAKPVRGSAGKVYFFQGCLVKFFFPEVREGVLKSLRHLGYAAELPEAQACCGAPSLHLGDEKAVRALAEQNLRSFEEENPDFILTVCPTGHAVLKNHYPRLDSRALRWCDRVVDFADFVGARGRIQLKRKTPDRGPLYYHYPCHYPAELKLEGVPTELLRSVGFEIAAAKEPPTCCGFCGVFSFRQPEISAHLWRNKKKEIEESQASIVATDCPGCLFQLRSGLAETDGPLRSYHTAEILAAHIERRRLNGDQGRQKTRDAAKRPGRINQ